MQIKTKSVMLGLLRVVFYCSGVFLGVTLAVVFDVNINLFLLKDVALEEWPNIDPRHRFIFIPLFSIIIIFVGLSVNLMLSAYYRSMRYAWMWMLIGFLHALPVFVFPLSSFMNLWPALLICLIIMLLCLMLVYDKFGVNQE